MVQKHVIGSTHLRINAPSKADGWRMQQDMSRLFWNDILNGIEEVLNELIPPDEIIKLDALEIILPTLDVQTWQHTLTPSVKKALKQELERLLLYPKATETIKIERQSISNNHFDAWLHFLLRGQLPTVYVAASDAVWQDAILETVATQSVAVKQLRQYLHQPEALQRLIYQFDEAFLTRLMEAMTGRAFSFGISLREAIQVFLQKPLLWDWVKNIQTLLRQDIVNQSINHRDFEILFWSIVYKKAIASEAIADDNSRQEALTHDILEAAFNQTFGLSLNQFTLKSLELFTVHLNKDNTLMSESTKRIAQLDTHKLVSSILIQQFKQTIETQANTTQEAFITKPSTSMTDKNKEFKEKEAPETSEIQPLNLLVETTTTESREATFKDADLIPSSDSNAELIIKTSFVRHAGLVLLHPFLVPLMNTLGLLKPDKSFKNKKAAAHAVSLLHYLSTGETAPPEYNLTLPKLLCGVSSRTSIDRYKTLSAAEKEEAESLLQAVIKHWGALGQVSNDSLRQGFLQRDGKLSRRDSDWLLQVESQTLDILLDRLPWGIGIIKLPWMTNMLFVEWH